MGLGGIQTVLSLGANSGTVDYTTPGNKQDRQQQFSMRMSDFTVATIEFQQLWTNMVGYYTYGCVDGWKFTERVGSDSAEGTEE